MRGKILGTLAFLMVVGAFSASACPPCSEWWLWKWGSTCDPDDYCAYCCNQVDACYHPQYCWARADSQPAGEAALPAASPFEADLDAGTCEAVVATEPQLEPEAAPIPTA